MSKLSSDSSIAGLNGVAIKKPARAAEEPAYRSFEVYQRQRPDQSTELINGAQLIAPSMKTDPFSTLAVLRENYPCYRDWINNAFWLTRYDDVTSVFTDNANFETRSNAWRYGDGYPGRNLIEEPAVRLAYASRFDAGCDGLIHQLIDGLSSSADLAIDYAARLPAYILAEAIGLPDAQFDRFASLLWLVHRGLAWHPASKKAGLAARDQINELLRDAWGQHATAEDASANMISAAVSIGAAPEDLTATIVELDQQTLHGLLANLWANLLSDGDHLERVRSEPGLLKIATLETLRHSPAVLSAQRFARHEVERFGCLIPEGALVICSAAAANRDPRIFSNPDTFVLDRNDICHREPRGQYRADGLASGIAFGLGPPSKHPAVPEDRPRSNYALVRDTAVRASNALMQRLDGLRIAGTEKPSIRSLGLGELFTCWHLPVTYRRKLGS